MLKNKIRNREVTIGSWINIPHPQIPEIMAAPGVDWLVIDMEHGMTDFEKCQTMIMAIQGKGLKALVRVGANDELICKRVLDAGADGIIMPMVKNETDVKKAIRHIYYPPKGARGVGLSRAQQYGVGFDEYCERLTKEIIFIAQIEHIEAVRNIDEIIANDDLDGILIGPYDLSASMGFPGQYDREDVKAALAKVEQACFSKKKALGFHVIKTDPQAVIDKLKTGYTFIAYSLDFIFLGESIRTGIEKIKSGFKL